MCPFSEDSARKCRTPNKRWSDKSRVSHHVQSHLRSLLNTSLGLCFVHSWHAGVLSDYVEDAEDALFIEETPIFVEAVAEEEVDETVHPTGTRREKVQLHNVRMTVRSSLSDSNKSG